jgi:hypothetical protein
MSQFYYSKTGEDIHGPIDEEDLISLYTSGALTHSTQIREVDDSQWHLLQDVIEIVPELHTYKLPHVTHTTFKQNRAQSASRNPPNKKNDNTAMSGWGFLILFAGIAITAYFAFFYDISVDVQSTYISGIGSIGGGSVNNLGLMQNRQMGIICGLAVSFIGVIMMIAASIRAR